MTRAISQDIQNDLRALLISNATYEEITVRLGVSKATIHRYCKSWNIKRPEHEAGRPTILSDAIVEVQQHFETLYSRLKYGTILNVL
ncbi:unnamed protein product [Rhizopus stolonifer]